MRREAFMRKNIFFFRDAQGEPVWKDTYVYAVLNGEEKNGRRRDNDR